MKWINYETTNRVATITLNRPEKRNALNHEVVAELKSAFNLAGTNKDVKVVVLKANGEAFCAGADLQYLQQLRHFSEEENRRDSDHLKELFEIIYTLDKVVIAQVQGHALAGGCGLATVCDFCIAAAEAKFGYTEVRIGFIPAIVMFFLVRKIGEARARQLLLTGELISATEAQQLGLINKVVESSSLTTEVDSLVQLLVNKNSMEAMAMTKQMIAEIQSMDMKSGLNYAAAMNAKARATDDCRRGIDSFLNKEKLSW